MQNKKLEKAGNSKDEKAGEPLWTSDTRDTKTKEQRLVLGTKNWPLKSTRASTRQYYKGPRAQNTTSKHCENEQGLSRC